MTLKTRKDIREEFARTGGSVSAWALRNGFSAPLVLAIINDDDENPVRKCLRGNSHDIAVTLGLKQGEVTRQSLAA